MTYEEARQYLDNATLRGSILGLESITTLLSYLGDPQDDLKVVHISGTNGKGSTLAFISTILKAAGYKVGRYISPTVICYEERIQVNEEYITNEALTRLTELVSHAVERMEREKGYSPTAFEIETAIAFLYYRECGCDIVVLECGMGGDTDATNVVKTTLVSVIASVSMDHMGFLGNTLGEIASHKAGIIKKGIPVVTTRQKPEAMESIRKKAYESGSALTVADAGKAYDIRSQDLRLHFSYNCTKGSYRDLETGLCGAYQIENALLAIEACEALKDLGYSISEEDIRRGLKDTVWIGRFTKIHDDPVIIIDGAHNEAAALKLAETLEMYFTNRKLMYIMGVLKDKEYDRILDIMLPYASKVVTVTPPNPRALSAKDLADIISSRNVCAVPAGSIKEAVIKAIDTATQDTAILCFGSLYYLGDIIRAVDGLSR